MTGRLAQMSPERVWRSATRSAVLSFADNTWIRESVARHGLRAGASRFVAGETLDECIEVLERLAADGMRVYAIALGEAVEDVAGAARAAETYYELIPEVSRRISGSTFSIKLSNIGLTLDAELALHHARRVVALAADHSAFVRLDMEGSATVDDTLSIYRKLRSDGLDNVGVVLQGYLYRSLDDLIDLLPLEPNIRVVKGAYLEPATVAHQRKSDVDQAYHQLIRTALKFAGFTAIATHDEESIRVATEVVAAHKPGFEFQMLYGVRYPLAQRLVGEGYAMRICVPYGANWFVYFTRRLAERPANLMFLLRNMVRS